MLARDGADKGTIAAELTDRFDYELSARPDDIRPHYRFDVSCQGSVPQSVISFLASESFEDALRTAVSLGGDSDTMACIAGAIAQPHYRGVPQEIDQEVRRLLPDDLRQVVEAFESRFIPAP